MATIKSGTSVTTNTIVRLAHNQGMHNALGQYGIVVDGPTHFPKYYSELCDKIGKKDADYYFLAVNWLPTPLRGTDSLDIEGEDGFYLKERFEIVEPNKDNN